MADKKEIIKNGKRVDGRALDELRPMEAKVGVLKNADGSAMFRLGNTSAIVGVYGPREVHPKRDEDSERAVLRTKYNMAPFSTKERGRPGPSRRSMEISMVIKNALSSVVSLNEFPKSAIDVHIEMIEADASTRCVGLNAASLALADAGIPMKDMIAACSAGKVQDTIVLDVAGDEDTEGQLDLPVAYYPRQKKVTLLQMDGLTDKQEFKGILELAIKGCEQIYQKQQEALRDKYEKGDKK
jgi:exosome complex component RRP41